MKRRIANNCGIEDIRNSLNTQMKVGISDIDFIQDMHTICCNIRFRHLAYVSLMRVADEIEDEIVIKYFKNKTEEEVAHKIWRLNDKRIRHGLESWI